MIFYDFVEVRQLLQVVSTTLHLLFHLLFLQFCLALLQLSLLAVELFLCSLLSLAFGNKSGRFANDGIQSLVGGLALFDVSLLVAGCPAMVTS